MKKILMAALLVLFSVPAFAGDGGGSDGCGLGWQVTQKKSFLATTTRATTNAIVPPTFGMSSGTIGCDQHTFAKKEMPALEYVASNYDTLLLEMSTGSGETLAALSLTMGCGSDFSAATKTNFGMLVESKGAVDLYSRLKSLANASGCTI